MTTAHWTVLDALEAAGARVALNATEAGERSLLPELALNDFHTDPVGRLAQAYWDHCVDVFQRPNTRLYAWLRPRLACRDIRGMVLWHFVGCDLWRAEAQTLRETFGLPLVQIDADEAKPISPRCLSRLQAFVETLQ